MPPSNGTIRGTPPVLKIILFLSRPPRFDRPMMDERRERGHSYAHASELSPDHNAGVLRAAGEPCLQSPRGAAPYVQIIDKLVFVNAVRAPRSLAGFGMRLVLSVGGEEQYALHASISLRRLSNISPRR